MNLAELGHRLINDSELSEAQWDSLVSEILEIVRQDKDIEKLRKFSQMELLAFPEEIALATVERLMYLGELNHDTLRAYWTRLELYYAKHGLRQWLGAELQRLKRSGGNAEEYKALGEQVLKRLDDGNVD